MGYDESVIDSIKEILVSRNETIAVAESVTSGHLQVALSNAVEASKYFQGGITAYNLGQKTRHLNIEPIHAQKVNCVAEQIAGTMAMEVTKLFLSSYGIAITGYATIVPECEKEGLFAWFAIANKSEVVLSKRLTSNKENTLDVQLDYTAQMLDLFHRWLKREK